MADLDDGPTGSTPDSEWFQRVADRSGLVFFILRVRPDVAFEFVNAGMRTQLVGSRPEATVAGARSVFDNLHPDSAGTLATLLAMEPGQSMWAELKWRHVSGRSVFSRGWISSRQRDDGSVVIEGALHDVTNLHAMETELRHSEQRHRLLAQNAWDVIWTMALDGSITYVSPAVERVRGFTPEEVMRQPLDEIHPPDSAAKVGAYFNNLFAAIACGDPPPSYHGEHRYYRKDGSIMVGELQVVPHVDADGKVVEILGVTRDISERKRFEAELTELAVTDPLTGLWNRRYCTQLLDADFENAQRHGQPLALLMIDIDHFKDINDTHGHQSGDRVLVEVARRLRDNLRGTDVIGRWGGEEFAVLLRFCTLKDALGAAEKLRRQISESRFDTLCTVTVSIGAAELLPDEDLLSWLGRADAALYEAKRMGRNTVVG